ncbi:MAG: hypothetical protein R2764_14030 [Bacteroidales bacterium]
MYAIKRFSFIFGILFASVIYIFGQEENELVAELKTLYPDENVVVLISEVIYTLEFDETNVPIAVIQTQEEQYISLQPSTYAVDVCFYDLYSEILKHKKNREGFFDPNGFQRCGNFEIDGIFYHDEQVCEYYLPFEEAGEQQTVKTVKKFNDLKYFIEVPFSQNYPIVNRRVRLELPKSVDLEFIEMNLEYFNINRSEQTDSVSGLKVIEYNVLSMPMFNGIENLSGYSCSYPHLLAIFKGYEVSGEYIGLLGSTKDLFDLYSSFVSESELSVELIEKTEQLVQTAKTDTAKIAAIYY